MPRGETAWLHAERLRRARPLPCVDPAVTIPSRPTKLLASTDRGFRSMELRGLIAFREVARQASFSQAAARLGYVQSTISAQIQSLERDLGAPLFDRLGRGISLTD